MKALLAVIFALFASVSFAAQPNSFLIAPGSNSQFSSQVRPFPTYVSARSLAANTAESITVPTGAKWVLFSSTCNFYANGTTTATVPGDVDDGTASELNPAAWLLQNSGVTSISVIATAACVITGSFYN